MCIRDSVPSVPIFVFSPSGSLLIISRHCAISTARSTSSIVASGLPYLIFSSREVLNSFVFWNTKEIYFISSSGAISLTLMPPIKTFPSVASQKRGTRRAIVVFPPPEAPTRATVFPCGIVKLTSVSYTHLPTAAIRKKSVKDKYK